MSRGNAKLEVGQLVLTSSTPPGNLGLYAYDQDTIGVVGDLVCIDPKSKAESSVVTSTVDPVTGVIELSAGGSTLSVTAKSIADKATTTRIGTAEVLTPAGMQLVPAGAVKRELRTFSTIPKYETVSSDLVIMDRADQSGLLFFRDYVTRKKLYSYDGTNFKLIKDFTGTDDSVEVVKELVSPSGAVTWLAVTHITSATQAGVRVYRSTDKGQTWAVSYTVADGWGVAPSETSWTRGNSIIFGEYFENTAGRYARIWYSDDAGVTFKTHTVTTRNGSHYHWCDAIDGTPEAGWFIPFGDGAYAGLIKLQYIAGSFVETAIKTNVDTHCVTKLKSGRWIKAEISVCTYDPDRLSESVKFQVRGDSVTGKYPYELEARGARTVFEYRGVLYAAFTSYSLSKTMNGLYASADDGETWVCIYRNGSAVFAGFRHGWGFGDYVYLQPQMTAGVTIAPTVRIKAVNAVVKSSIRTDHPIRNRIATQALSTFTNTDGSAAPIGTANGGWGDDALFENPTDGAPALIEVVKGGFDGSGHMLHCRTKAAGVAGKNNIITSPALSVLCAGNVPVSGDYFCAVARFRAPDCGIYNISLSMRSLTATEQHQQIYTVAGTDWMELRCWGRWPSAPASNHRLWIRVDNPSSDISTNKAFDYYIDSVRLFAGPTPSAWVIDNRNGVVGQPAVPDVVQMPMTTVGTEWTVLADLTCSGAIEQQDGVIAAVTLGGSKKLTVSYIAGAYVLSDGVLSAQTSARTRAVADIVRMAIVSDGTEASLVIEDTTGAMQRVGQGVGIKTGSPICVTLGGDNQIGSFTAGNWSNILEIPRSISESEISEIWQKADF